MLHIKISFFYSFLLLFSCVILYSLKLQEDVKNYLLCQSVINLWLNNFHLPVNTISYLLCLIWDYGKFKRRYSFSVIQYWLFLWPMVFRYIVKKCTVFRYSKFNWWRWKCFDISVFTGCPRNKLRSLRWFSSESRGKTHFSKTLLSVIGMLYFGKNPFLGSKTTSKNHLNNP